MSEEHFALKILISSVAEVSQLLSALQLLGTRHTEHKTPVLGRFQGCIFALKISVP